MVYDDIERMVIQALVPNQGAALWIGFIVTFLIAGNLERLWSRRNLALAALLSVSVVLVDIHRFASRTESSAVGRYVFTALFTLTGLMTAWGLVGSFSRTASRPANVPVRGLAVIAVALVLLDVVIGLGRHPEDCGIYTNLGAQRWRETGVIPYSDEKLRGPESPGHGAAATYGPLLYAGHMPFQLLLGPPDNDPGLDPQDRAYRRPPRLASSLPCVLLHLAGLAALFGIGRRLGGPGVAWSLVCLYAGSPYVIGVGGEERILTGGPVGGMAWISHVGPAAAVLLTLYFLHRPLLAGVMLAVGAGLLFFPAFLFPVFFGWYLWRGAGWGRFAVSFAVSGLLIGALVVGFMHEDGISDAAERFLSCTLEHQEGDRPDQYGTTPFSFWANQPELAAFWQAPLRGESSLTKPVFLGFVSLAALAFFLARGKSEAGLAFLVAAVTAGVQLWKTNAAGTYVEWYYPFLLIGLLGRTPREVEGHVRTQTPPSPPDDPAAAG